ncbi:hypothetical protein RIMD111065_16410 [Aeromonas hydrophila]|nr:hypothetical protein RIMD111065_16410 [Aeromonas hydrophila]
MVRALLPSTVTMNRGSRLWIISDEMSISRLTKPSTQTPRGIRREGGAGSCLLPVVIGGSLALHQFPQSIASPATQRRPGWFAA